MSSWETALPSGLGEAFPGDGAGAGVRKWEIHRRGQPLALPCSVWVDLRHQHAAVPGPGLWIRDICTPGNPPNTPPCILNLPPASLSSPPPPKSLLRETQAFPAAFSTTPRGQNHSPGVRSPGLRVEAKEDPLNEQGGVQGGPARACWKEEGKKEAGKEEVKARTRLPERLPRRDLHTPWRAGSTLPAQQGWLGSLARQGLVRRSP